MHRRHRRRDLRDIPCGADEGGSAGLQLLGDGAAGAAAHPGDDDDRRARIGIPASFVPTWLAPPPRPRQGMRQPPATSTAVCRTGARCGLRLARVGERTPKRTTLPPAMHIGINGGWVRSMGKMPPSTRPSVTLRFADDLLIALDTATVQLSSTVRPSGVEQPLVCLGHLLMTDAGVGFEALTIQNG